jgi:hypothetical protein
MSANLLADKNIAAPKAPIEMNHKPVRPDADTNADPAAWLAIA